MIGLGGRWDDDERAALRALLSTDGTTVIDVEEPPALPSGMRACVLAPGEALDAPRWRAAAGATRLLFTCDSVAACRGALVHARPMDDVCGVLEDRELQVARLWRLLRPFASGPHDETTGLPNRAALRSASEDWVHDPTGGQVDAVLMVDLDHFKSINDRFGHGVADNVLRAVGRVLPDVPGVDGAWRYGGEEFVLRALMPDAAAVEALANRVREAITSTRVIPAREATPIHVTASIGWALFEGSLDDACQCAEMALYQAKSAGRDCVVGFHQLAGETVGGVADAEIRHFENVVRVVNERTARLVTLFGRKLMQRARTHADQDPLTGLWNHGHALRRLTRELALSRADGRPLTVIMLDLDHFGRFNKTEGIPTGDAVLRGFARVASQCLRASDWIARHGGEEFLVVLPGPLSDGETVAERIRSTVAATPIEGAASDVDGRGPSMHRITVSAGVATATRDTVDATSLLLRASEALNRAKATGRDRVASAAP